MCGRGQRERGCAGGKEGVCGRGQRDKGCVGGKEGVCGRGQQGCVWKGAKRKRVCVEGGKEKEGVWKEAKRVCVEGVKRVCVWKMAWVRGGHEGVYGRGQSGHACGSGQSV